MGDLYQELLVELECPICTNYMAPPIRQCVTGHSICHPCRIKLPKCPLCQGLFTESKNLSLEALADKMHYPCINKDSGCEEQLTLKDREAHEKTCSFKGFKCGMERCSWSGKLENVLEHWNSKKMKSKIYEGFNICHTKIKSDSYYTNLVQAYGNLFWFKCKLTRGKIFWSVQILGNKEEAEKYYYEIEIFKSGLSKRKILYTDYCQSVEVENNDLFTDTGCLSASIDSMNRFLGDDQLLIYYMRVRPIENDNRNSRESNSKRNINKRFDKNNQQRDRSQGAAKREQDKEKQAKRVYE